MNPVLILQHLSADGPAYLGRWLRAAGVPFEVRNTEAGDPYPAGLDGYSALAVLGGEMSANDPLPSLREAEALIVEAMRTGRPVIGHCLGGQLMARALGARVDASPRPEVGWQPLRAEPAGQAWFGEGPVGPVFQWHYEAFELPPGAVRLATSDAYPNQAFAIGPHLGMQFHIEVDHEKVERWSADTGERFRAALAAHPGSVQDGTAMRRGITRWLTAHQALADRLYQRWLSGAT